MTDRRLKEIVRGGGVIAAPPETPVREAARRMKEHNVAAILVMVGERLAGIFTERDLLRRVVAPGLDADATPLSDVMTPDPVAIADEETAVQAMRVMRELGLRHLPVVKGRTVVGIVSMRDFIGDELAAVEREKDLRERLWEA